MSEQRGAETVGKPEVDGEGRRKKNELFNKRGDALFFFSKKHLSNSDDDQLLISILVVNLAPDKKKKYVKFTSF